MELPTPTIDLAGLASSGSLSHKPRKRNRMWRLATVLLLLCVGALVARAVVQAYAVAKDPCARQAKRLPNCPPPPL